MISNASSSLGYLYALSSWGFQRVQKVQHWKHHFSSQEDRQRREDAGSKAKRWIKGKGDCINVPDCGFFHIVQIQWSVFWSVTFLHIYAAFLDGSSALSGKWIQLALRQYHAYSRLRLITLILLCLRDYLDISECSIRQEWHHLYNEQGVPYGIAAFLYIAKVMDGSGSPRW